jgi:predicted hotdog family 3-hydroxylacyl-ACP dehydratase
LRAIHLCEYGAQAMAVHGGLVAQAEGRVAQPGFLVSLRDVRLEIDFIEALAADLRVTAQRLLETPASWQYAFTIEHEGKTLATGRAAVVARPSR